MIDLTFLIKYLPALAKLLGHQVFVSVKVDRDEETTYTLKINNSSKYVVEIVRLIATPSVLAKNNSFTSFNESKFFKNKLLPPGESIEFIFRPSDVQDLQNIFRFKAEYIVRLPLGIAMRKTSEEYRFCPIEHTVKIGRVFEQGYN